MGKVEIVRDPVSGKRIAIELETGPNGEVYWMRPPISERELEDDE